MKGVKWFKSITIAFSVILILFSCLYISSIYGKKSQDAISATSNVIDKVKPLKNKIKAIPLTDKNSKNMINKPLLTLSTKVTKNSSTMD